VIKHRLNLGLVNVASLLFSGQVLCK